MSRPVLRRRQCCNRIVPAIAAELEADKSNGSRKLTVGFPALVDNHRTMADARAALAYPEIIGVLDAVCGLGMSLKGGEV